MLHVGSVLRGYTHRHQTKNTHNDQGYWRVMLLPRQCPQGIRQQIHSHPGQETARPWATSCTVMANITGTAHNTTR